MRPRADSVVYRPDVMVACGSEPADERIEVAPCLVIEVLSPSTEAIDRREKLLVYKGMSTLTLDEIYEDVTLPTPEQQLRLREEEAAYF